MPGGLLLYSTSPPKLRTVAAFFILIRSIIVAQSLSIKLACWTDAFEFIKADAVRPQSQASPGAGGVGVAQAALVVLAVGALLATVARRRSASTML